MLKKIEGLPTHILGIRAEGTVSREDYEEVLIPLLENAQASGAHIRFLYQFSPEFSGFTPGAAWDELKADLRYLSLFERCAIISDATWMTQAIQLFSILMPFPCKIFLTEDREEALTWLISNKKESALKHEFIADKQVLIIEPHRALHHQDFEKLAAIVDPMIELHGNLQGIVVHVKNFPGWEDVGSFIHHLQFVRDHHRKIRKVALVVDGVFPALLPQFTAHFIEAEVKHFTFGDLDRAIAWAARATDKRNDKAINKATEKKAPQQDPMSRPG